jgi:hypothetical protein
VKPKDNRAWKPRQTVDDLRTPTTASRCCHLLALELVTVRSGGSPPTATARFFLTMFGSDGPVVAQAVGTNEEVV